MIQSVRKIGSLTLVALLAFGVVGTASAAAPGAHGAASITPPPSVAKAGKLVFCSDVSYPPEEFFQGSTPVGSDVDIAGELARRMGVKVEVDNTGFDGIIAALLANKCDAIISGMNDTASRRKQVSFIDYLSVGQSIMVQKGNPTHIKTLDDLSGKTVGAEVGTTNLDFIKQLSTKLKAKGKAPINTVVFPKDSDGANALRLGKLDAYESDAPVVAYYISKDPGAFEFGIAAIEPIPVGIAVRKQDNALRAAIQKGINGMYADGSMMRILKKWKLGPFALKKK
jgi:polar amino acid transport system substrate-binding protein